MALSWTMDKLGPMCRTADDCGIVLDAIAGPDVQDAMASARPYRYPGPRAPGRAKKPVIGILKNATAGSQPEVAANFEASLAVLRSFATLVPDVEFPDLPFNAAAETIINAEGASAFEDLLESGRVNELTAPEDRWGGYPGAVVLATDYLKALRLRGVMSTALDEVMRRYDCVVAPTLDTVSFPIDKPFDKAWPPIDVPKDVRRVPLGGAANIVGLPGISIPNGFGQKGLPTGIVFTGRQFADTAVILAAAELQARTDWHRKRPVGYEG